MKEAGTKLRETLLDIDFGLQDSFCDSTDLKASWERTMIPAPFLSFLAALFHIPKYKLFRSKATDLDELIQTLDNNEDLLTDADVSQQQEQEENWATHHKSTQLHCLFQVMAYNIHSGLKRTPLHMMLGHALYARDNSTKHRWQSGVMKGCFPWQLISIFMRQIISRICSFAWVHSIGHVYCLGAKVSSSEAQVLMTH